MKTLKKIGLVLGAGAIAFVIFTFVALGLTFLADFLKESVGLESWLFVGSFLKPIALVFVGSWLWISGRFLSKAKPTKYGRYLLVLWVVASVGPYLLSFFFTQSS